MLSPEKAFQVQSLIYLPLSPPHFLRQSGDGASLMHLTTFLIR